MLSRRSLLTGMAGSLVFSSRALSATSSLPELSFCIISDTHLGRKDRTTPLHQWEQAVSQMNGGNAVLVLHLGDVVDGGREPQYPLYVQARQKLDKPVFEVPGNHDPQALFAKYLREEVDVSVERDGIRFVLFNNSDPESHLGFIKPHQLKWLASQCAAAAKADQFLVLACHVPVHTNRDPDRGWYVKPQDGQTDLYALLDQYKQRVLCLVHGHFHNGIRGWTDHSPLIEFSVPSNCYNQDRKLIAKRAPGFIVDELRPGYVLATLGRGKLRLDYKPLQAESKAYYEAAIGGQP